MPSGIASAMNTEGKKHRKEAADRAAERLQNQKRKNGGQVELDLPYRKKFSLI